MSNRTRSRVAAGLLFAFCLIASTAQAGLVELVQFKGRGNWSLDGAAGQNAGPLEAIVPVGATIEHAFLYAQHTIQNAYPDSFSHILFEGNLLTKAAGVELAAPVPPGSPTMFAYRYDVKSIVETKFNEAVIGPPMITGGDVHLTFDVFEDVTSPNIQVNGEVLAIIYSHPDSPESTIVFRDGALDMAGDSTVITYDQPLGDVSDPDVQVQLSLGIGHSAQTSAPRQSTVVDVNGRRLTSSAGGQGDGSFSQGQLITVGGIGDTTANPSPFAIDGDLDDELYDLSLPPGGQSPDPPYVVMGDTVTLIETSNSSGDDMVFFMGLNINAAASVNGSTVPEPSSVMIWAMALIGGCVWHRRRRRAGK